MNLKDKIFTEPNQILPFLKNKKIVMCHGVYDLFHIGHLKQFYFAKKLGDVLVVSITHENFVNKDIRRPLFDIEKRMDIIASNEVVDYVVVSNAKFADKNIDILKPNIYVKDQEYKNSKDLGIKIEERALKKNKGKLVFSKLEKFSSSKIYDYYFNLHSNKRFNFLKQNYDLKKLNNILSEMKDLEVSIIGEFIIDSYENTTMLGVPSKATCLSTLSKNYYQTYGGSYAVAKHISQFVKKVNLYTNMSNGTKRKLKNNNINIINIHPEDFEKKRILDQSTQNRMIEITYDFKKKCDFKNKINKNIGAFKKSDLVIIADYGQNFIDKKFLNKLIKDNKKFYSTNIQSNSYNRGFNYLDLYKKSDFIVIDKHELSINFRLKNLENPRKYMSILEKKYHCAISVTMGKFGAIALDKKKFFTLEAFSKYIIDSVGAGDAYFALASLFYYKTKDIKFATLTGSIAAAIATKYIGNVEYISKKDVVSNVKKFLSFEK